MPPIRSAAATTAPGFGLLLRLKLSLLRNRVRQLADQAPLRMLLVMLFVAIIWGALYALFDAIFVLLRRFEHTSVIAIPYVFHIFFVAMTVLLAFSTAVLVYGALFGRDEPSFLLAAPNRPRDVVAILYLEALFFSSWSLVLLGLPLMMAIGRVEGLPWHFYVTFVIAFLGFVPIPGALGLVLALAVALWLPRLARRTLLFAGGAALVLVVIGWGRVWAVSSSNSQLWLQGIMGELQYLKAALLPSTWVTQAIQHSIEDRPADAAFYLAVTVSTALFFSWLAVTVAGDKLLLAFGRAYAAPNRARVHGGWASRGFTRLAFCYLPPKMRILILKDVRNFLRDPTQWSQLAILFGLLGLYLLYLPRSRPTGFTTSWQVLICFLNYGAVTLILSTFTSRFVFPMISLEGRQMWLVGLWPLSRGRVLWAKFFYALTVTGIAALSVTGLSIRALDLPGNLAFMQVLTTLTTCAGLCGLAVGLGARIPCFHETNAGRIASGLGGTVNLIASVGLVAVSVGLCGIICFRMIEGGTLTRLDGFGSLLFAMNLLVGLGTAGLAMRTGVRTFRRQEF